MKVPFFFRAEGWVDLATAAVDEADAAGKAKLFASTFASKFSLISIEQNTYSYISNSTTQQVRFNPSTKERAKIVLRALKADSSTGPDLLPA